MVSLLAVRSCSIVNFAGDKKPRTPQNLPTKTQARWAQCLAREICDGRRLSRRLDVGDKLAGMTAGAWARFIRGRRARGIVC